MSLYIKKGRTMNHNNSPIVIVHGAWTGAWSWQKVVSLLQAEGYSVSVPTLSGLGERSHLADRDIDLDTHIADIVNEILWKDLKNVTLVCHSYGGFVATGAIEKLQDRIASIVFLDAFIPEDKTSFSNLNPNWNEKGPLVRVPKLERVQEKATPQPIRTMTQKIRHTGAYQKVPKKTFIVATGWEGPFAEIAAKLANDPTWQLREISSGHDAPLENPKDLARLIMEATDNGTAKHGLKSSGTSSNVKTGNVPEEQKMKREDASWDNQGPG